MNFLCPACRTPLPVTPALSVVPCTSCGVEVDLTRMDTAPGSARLWPDVDLTGESLGGYQLKARIGAGGMGAVYDADGPGGACAVKVLSALLAAEPALRVRFRREAAALRAISHEGVVRVLAEGEERGFCWYSMERVTGPDLRARIAEARLTPAETSDLARRLLSALEVVHQAGFVHRDVKPGNILLAASGPKLCDFGIARFDGSSTLTESAAMLGSLRYMAPEQRFGRADSRSDLYAAGVVLHECLAGGVPGEAELPPGVPARLRKFITALTANRPEERPATAAAALALFERRARPLRAGLGAAAVAMVGIAGVASFNAGWWDEGGGPGPATPIVVSEKQAPIVKMAAPQNAEPPRDEVKAQAPALENALKGETQGLNNIFGTGSQSSGIGLGGLGTKGRNITQVKSRATAPPEAIASVRLAVAGLRERRLGSARLTRGQRELTKASKLLGGKEGTSLSDILGTKAAPPRAIALVRLAVAGRRERRMGPAVNAEPIRKGESTAVPNQALKRGQGETAQSPLAKPAEVPNQAEPNEAQGQVAAPNKTSDKMAAPTQAALQQKAEVTQPLAEQQAQTPPPAPPSKRKTKPVYEGKPSTKK
ncbi:MAG: protein kinase domain-containing protein [Myxococcaceae bacterium]